MMPARAQTMAACMMVACFASASVAGAHNAAPGVLDRERGVFSYEGNAWSIRNFLCDNIYRVGPNPEEAANPACPFTARADNTGSGTQIYAWDVDHRAVVVTTNRWVNLSLDCAKRMSNPERGGSMSFLMWSEQHNESTGQCSFSWTAGEIGNVELVPHTHWVDRGLAEAPARYVWWMRLKGTYGESFAQMNYTLNWFDLLALPIRISFLSDPSQNDAYEKILSDAREYQIRDPNSDTRLFVGGLDVTPAIGGYYQLTPTTRVDRLNGGNGSVLWVVTSSAETTYLYIPVDADRPGYWEFDVHEVVV